MAPPSSVFVLAPLAALLAGSAQASTLHEVYQARDQGLTDEALAHLDAVEARLGPTADVLVARGLIAGEDRGSWEDAVALLGRATELDPQRPAAWVFLGDALLATDQAEPAVQALQRARELAPHHPWVLDHLAAAFRHAGQRSEAVRTWEEAALLYAAEGDAQQAARIAYTLKDLGAPDLAESVAEAASHADPADTEAWLALGHVRRDRLRLRLAREAYGRAVLLRPEALAPRDALSRSLEVDGWVPRPEVGVSLLVAHESVPVPTESLVSEQALASVREAPPSADELIRTTSSEVLHAEGTLHAGRWTTFRLMADGRQSRDAYLNSLFAFEDIRAVTAGASIEQAIPGISGLDDVVLTWQYFYARFDSPDLDAVRRDRHQLRVDLRLAPSRSRAVLHLGGSRAVEDYLAAELGTRHWFGWLGAEYRHRRVGLLGRYEAETVRFVPGELNAVRHAARAGAWLAPGGRLTARLATEWVTFLNEDPTRDPVRADGRRLQVEPGLDWRLSDALELSVGPTWATGLTSTDFDSLGGAAAVRLGPRVSLPYRDGELRTRVDHRALLSAGYGYHHYLHQGQGLHTLRVAARL